MLTEYSGENPPEHLNRFADRAIKVVYSQIFFKEIFMKHQRTEKIFKDYIKKKRRKKILKDKFKMSGSIFENK